MPRDHVKYFILTKGKEIENLLTSVTIVRFSDVVHKVWMKALMAASMVRVPRRLGALVNLCPLEGENSF